MMTKPKAVILVSGGLDSATLLAQAVADGYACHTLAFDYGQRHRAELIAAEQVSRALGAIEHKVVTLDLRSIGGSALTDQAIAVPTERGEGIPVTYVPARNTVRLIEHRLGRSAECVRRIFIGVNAVDYSGYPDCRPDFINAFQALANVAMKAAVEGSCADDSHATALALSVSPILFVSAQSLGLITR